MRYPGLVAFIGGLLLGNLYLLDQSAGSGLSSRQLNPPRMDANELLAFETRNLDAQGEHIDNDAQRANVDVSNSNSVDEVWDEASVGGIPARVETKGDMQSFPPLIEIGWDLDSELGILGPTDVALSPTTGDSPILAFAYQDAGLSQKSEGTRNGSIFVPVINQTAIIAFEEQPFVIEGQDFGTLNENNPSQSVEFISDKDHVVVDAADESVHQWTDTRIELELPVGVNSTYWIQVINSGRVSKPADLLTYRFTEYLQSPEDPALPGPMLYDWHRDQFWMFGEFNTGFSRIHRGITDIEFTKFPLDDNIFVSALTMAQEELSDAGEHIEMDSQGNIWFSQGGGGWGVQLDENQQNASRLVKYNPDDESYQCFYSPQDNAVLSGFVLANSDVFVVSTIFDTVYWFRPSTFTPTQTDCASAQESLSLARFCDEFETDGCFRAYPLPEQFRNDTLYDWVFFGHLVAANDHLYITAFFDSSVYELNPDTGEYRRFPLPLLGRDPCDVHEFCSTGPWYIKNDPIDPDVIWITEFFDLSVQKLMLNNSQDCTALDDDGNNPCIVEFSTEQLTPQQDVLVNFEFAENGMIWFTNQEFALQGMEVENGGKLGMLNPLTSEVILTPPLNLVIDSQPFWTVGATHGIVIDPDDQSLWFSYWPENVGQLTPY